MIRMTKETMKARIEEAQEGGDEEYIKTRVAICLDGLRSQKNGYDWANELVDEMGLEKYGATRVDAPVEENA